MECFADLGSNVHLADEVFDILEQFVCKLNGGKSNDERYKMFKKKNESDHKYIDLALLPPCQPFLYRLFRNNFMSKMNKKGHGNKIAFAAKPSYKLATGNKIYV